MDPSTGQGWRSSEDPTVAIVYWRIAVDRTAGLAAGRLLFSGDFPARRVFFDD